MRKTLTQKTLDHLQPASGKRYELRDTLLPGFMLRVSKSGGTVWYLAARVNGRQRRIKIGSYPVLSLVDALLESVAKQTSIGDSCTSHFDPESKSLTVRRALKSITRLIGEKIST